MLHNYRRMPITKELKNYTRVDCIIICQNILDFAAVEMILDKKVKRIINCVDYIFITKSLELIDRDIIYLPAACFDIFDSFGLVDINNNIVSYNNKSFEASTPERKNINCLFEGFVNNTVEHMIRERFLINEVVITGINKDIKPAAVLISRGEYGKEDLKYLKKIIKEEKPSIICVDGGFDIALKNRLLPDMVIGDMDSISRITIAKCSSFIIHSYLDGTCPGLEKIPRNKKIGFIKCFGTSEDAAILYCIKKGCAKIYTLGYHVNSLEYIEKGRLGMASSLLIRLYYGHIIRDIKESKYYTSKMIYLVSSAAVILIILYFSFLENLTLWVFK